MTKLYNIWAVKDSHAQYQKHVVEVVRNVTGRNKMKVAAQLQKKYGSSISQVEITEMKGY